jgi:regulator of protease activity HflC (stomatin/prohibitin superfamily)
MYKLQELTWKDQKTKLKHMLMMLSQEQEGKRKKILQAAEAYKKQVVAKAEGEASRFVSIFNEYDKAQ